MVASGQMTLSQGIFNFATEQYDFTPQNISDRLKPSVSRGHGAQSARHFMITPAQLKTKVHDIILDIFYIWKYICWQFI